MINTVILIENVVTGDLFQWKESSCGFIVYVDDVQLRSVYNLCQIIQSDKKSNTKPVTDTVSLFKRNNYFDYDFFLFHKESIA